MLVLVINCGSSSIKYQLFEMPAKTVLAKGVVEKIGHKDSSLTHKVDRQKHEIVQAIANHQAGVELILRTLADPEIGVMSDIHDIGAVGHRVVHGGEEYSASVVIGEKVKHCIEKFADLAPLHNPPNLTGIHAVEAALPGVPNVAVFDTAFHQTIPAKAYLYALPYELYEKYGVRKYGFHGTSHAYVLNQAAKMLGQAVEETSVITCHLGNGASMAAIENGKCVDTTMGMTPLAGLVMGTRCGDIDPAIIFYLLGKEEFNDYHDIDKMMNKKSGLLGVSGVSNDMRDLLAAAEKEGPKSRPQMALDMFCYRLGFYLGAYMAILDKVDAIVFTGGIGENGPDEREGAVHYLHNLDVYLDSEKNKSTIRGKSGDIASDNSKSRVLVIPTDEEGWIASETHRLCAEEVEA